MEQKALQKLVEEVSIDFFELPFRHQATFNARLKTTGGRYFLQSHHLDFNPQVLEKFGMETLIGVIKHELCHYHLHLAGKGHQHKDRAFKALLKKVGGLRYVPSMKEAGADEWIQLWKYQCQKCGTNVRRKRRFNTNKYVCSNCKGAFKLLGREEVQL